MTKFSCKTNKGYLYLFPTLLLPLLNDRQTVPNKHTNNTIITAHSTRLGGVAGSTLNRTQNSFTAVEHEVDPDIPEIAPLSDDDAIRKGNSRKYKPSPNDPAEAEDGDIPDVNEVPDGYHSTKARLTEKQRSINNSLSEKHILGKEDPRYSPLINDLLFEVVTECISGKGCYKKDGHLYICNQQKSNEDDSSGNESPNMPDGYEGTTATQTNCLSLIDEAIKNFEGKFGLYVRFETPQGGFEDVPIILRSSTRGNGKAKIAKNSKGNVEIAIYAPVRNVRDPHAGPGITQRKMETGSQRCNHKRGRSSDIHRDVELCRRLLTELIPNCVLMGKVLDQIILYATSFQQLDESTKKQFQQFSLCSHQFLLVVGILNSFKCLNLTDADRDIYQEAADALNEAYRVATNFDTNSFNVKDSIEVLEDYASTIATLGEGLATRAQHIMATFFISVEMFEET